MFTILLITFLLITFSRIKNLDSFYYQGYEDYKWITNTSFMSLMFLIGNKKR